MVLIVIHQWKINALLAYRLGMRFLHWIHYTYLITCINTIHNGQYTVTLINNVVIVYVCKLELYTGSHKFITMTNVFKKCKQFFFEILVIVNKLKDSTEKAMVIFNI